MRYHSVVVDVDNTLFDYATQVSMLLKRDGVLYHPPSQWTDWDYLNKFMSKHDADEYFNEAHKMQLDFMPFDDARTFLEKLISEYGVIIASHRRQEHYQPLRVWLMKNDLPFDEVWVGTDKTAMFNRALHAAVVDDCPAVLQAAVREKIPAYGLRRAWNANCEYGTLCDSLTEVGALIL